MRLNNNDLMISSRRASRAVEIVAAISNQYDLIGNRTGEWREGFAFASTHNSLNQITNRSWSGTLTVSGYVTNRLNPGKRGVDVGVQTVDVNMQAASPGGQGGYVAQNVLVTSSKAQVMTNNLITAVNKDAPLPRIGDTKRLDMKSIKWETINVEPSLMVPTYDARGNLTSDGVRTYTWNGHNQLARIQDSGNVALLDIPQRYAIIAQQREMLLNTKVYRDRESRF
jgi:hypothetical protein